MFHSFSQKSIPYSRRFGKKNYKHRISPYSNSRKISSAVTPGRPNTPATEGVKAISGRTDPGNRLQQAQQCQYPQAAYRAAQQTAQPAVLAGCAAHHAQQADDCRRIGQ